MGTVVGIDLRQTDPVPGCVVLCGDITDPARIAELRAAVPGGQYDVVLSDLSPALSGVRARDEARAAELNAITLRIADELLAPGGILLMKIFMDGETEATLRQARRQFASVRLKRPRASRKGSAEQYLIGTAARAGGGAS